MCYNSRIMQKPDTIFLIAIVSMVVLAIGSTFWLFYLQKNYLITTEASCNSEIQTCYARECSENEEDCPPNQLESYTIYTFKARDIDKCFESSCSKECQENLVECEEIVCGGNEDDSCSIQ